VSRVALKRAVVGSAEEVETGGAFGPTESSWCTARSWSFNAVLLVNFFTSHFSQTNHFRGMVRIALVSP